MKNYCLLIFLVISSNSFASLLSDDSKAVDAIGASVEFKNRIKLGANPAEVASEIQIRRPGSNIYRYVERTHRSAPFTSRYADKTKLKFIRATQCQASTTEVAYPREVEQNWHIVANERYEILEVTRNYLNQIPTLIIKLYLSRPDGTDAYHAQLECYKALGIDFSGLNYESVENITIQDIRDAFNWDINFHN